MLQEPGRALDLASANRFGQQLFFANMAIQRRKTPRLTTPPRQTGSTSTFTPRAGRQEPLFRLARDVDTVKTRALTADSDLLHYCADIVRAHSARHGWSKRQRNAVTHSLRLLQVLQDTPGAKIRASDVLQLPRYGGSTISTLDVLEAAGLLHEDRPTRVEQYFASKTQGLPEPMSTELETWLHVMLDGSTQPPRRRSRDPRTVSVHILGIAPIIQRWAEQGHASLAEITPQDVRDALPERGSHRNFAEYGLRSLFTVLKARKLVFINPTRGMKATPVNASVPLPLDTAAIHQAINSPDPAIALAVALVAFHALTNRQVRELKNTDIVDGALAIAGRTIPLAGPVRVRLAAWLDHRDRTWPGTANPHLFISRRSAPRLVTVGPQFPWHHTNLRPQALREDRILQEIHATGGDVRRICDLFGIHVSTALRYADTLGHPGLTVEASAPSRTPGPHHASHGAHPARSQPKRRQNP